MQQRNSVDDKQSHNNVNKPWQVATNFRQNPTNYTLHAIMKQWQIGDDILDHCLIAIFWSFDPQFADKTNTSKYSLPQFVFRRAPVVNTHAQCDEQSNCFSAIKRAHGNTYDYCDRNEVNSFIGPICCHQLGVGHNDHNTMQSGNPTHRNTLKVTAMAKITELMVAFLLRRHAKGHGYHLICCEKCMGNAYYLLTYNSN